MSPEVSVIVLAYNQEATIARALESILSQKCEFAYEVIIGEDASTDGTRSICQQYVDRYEGLIKLMPRTRNKGIVKNYFDCFAVAQGRYIADCTGGDYWTSEYKLARQYEELERSKNVAIVHSGWNGHIEKLEHIVPGREMLEMVLGHNRGATIHLSTALYRADILRESMAIDEDVVCNESFGCEDLPILSSLLSRGDAVYIAESVLAYDDVGEGVSHSSDLKRSAEFACKTAYATYQLALYYKVDVPEIRQYLKRRISYAMSLAFQLKDESLASEVERLRMSIGVPYTIKARIYRASMNIDVVWHMAKAMRVVKQSLSEVFRNFR